MAILTSFLILSGAGVIVNLLILKKYWGQLTESGFIEASAMSLPIYFLVLAMLAFLIFELNK